MATSPESRKNILSTKHGSLRTGTKPGTPGPVKVIDCSAAPVIAKTDLFAPHDIPIYNQAPIPNDSFTIKD